MTTTDAPVTVENVRDMIQTALEKTQGPWPSLPWKVVPVDGKPVIASDRGGNLFRGYIATWQEADLIVALVNSLPAILAALASAPAAVDARTLALVIAAREFWDIHNDLSDESRALDKALEPFSASVPYENEPASAPAGDGVERFVIRRNGAFFRPNAQGYTNHVIAAGYYTRAEADHYADVEGVTIEPLERYRDDAERTIAEAQRLLAALARPRAAKEAVDFVREWLMSGDHPVSDWERQFAAAIDVRPRAAVGEREAEELRRIVRWIDKAIERAENHRNTEGIWLFASQWQTVRDILALQSPPAKVEGRHHSDCGLLYDDGPEECTCREGGNEKESTDG